MYAGNAYTGIDVRPDSTSRGVQDKDDRYVAATQAANVLNAEVENERGIKDRLTLPRRWRPRMCMSCQVPGANEAKAPSPNMRPAAKHFAYLIRDDQPVKKMHWKGFLFHVKIKYTCPSRTPSLTSLPMRSRYPTWSIRRAQSPPRSQAPCCRIQYAFC